jgi:hypothetical protein
MTVMDILGIDPSMPRAAVPDRFPPGVTVLVPTHGDRLDPLRLCLSSLAAEVAGDGTPVVVVADRLDPATGRRLTALAAELRGRLRVEVVPSLRGSAAGARNVGLDHLRARPELLRNRLLFLDDDSVPGRGAPAALSEVLDQHPAAVAACPRVVPVGSLARWRTRVPRATAGSRRLSGSLRPDRSYDLLSVTSHGSLVAGRTVGLMIRTSAWHGWGGRLFYEGTPRRSTEDMLAMATLSCLGELRVAGGVQVADLARATPEDTRAQQLRWGYDHAWLAGALAQAGLVQTGLRVLSWDRGWQEATVPDDQHTGYLVNPAEVAALAGALESLLPEARALFGPDASELGKGLRCLRRLLTRLPGLPAATHRRPDLPPLVRRDYRTIRDGLDAALAHLAGNVLGSLAHGLAPDGLPRAFLYGLRQRADVAAARR